MTQHRFKTALSQIFYFGLIILIAISFGAFAANTGFSAVAQEDAKSPWAKQCDPLPSDKQMCYVTQALRVKEGGQRLIYIGVGQSPDTGLKFLLFVTPLGVLLRPGIELKIDDGAPFNAQFNTCLPNGCHGQIALNEDQYQQLRKGNKLLVFYIDVRQQKISLDMSLEGFSVAYDSEVKIN